MTAISREMFEEFIGIKMLELARSEGHFPNMPNTTSAPSKSSARRAGRAAPEQR